ncbi:hypothetical protein [Azospirillum doebereinerae]|uniref:Uncharacterized protein n=1 Tax=Azospirillum doebereinerae TaxID=92933 RepID=A0A433JBY3_9PROT|nr:hypothetical protein [Azospirillum doebereinerae]RUQ74046.1 hypothetical protein EJ913_06665 [Azospirillum doebereinerae]
MTGFSIAGNAWGIHTVLHKGLGAAELTGWQTALREAAVRCGASGRRWGVIADIRALTPAEGAAVAAALTELAERPDLERGAVIAAEDGQAERFGQASGGRDPGRKLRVLAVEGRDRVQIAAAYGWTLNGTEPCHAHGVPAGTVVAFPARSMTGMAGLRKAS